MTLAQAQAELALWQAALEAILGGAQSYSIAGRTLTRADLATVTANRDKWQRTVDQLGSRSGRGVRAFRVIPRDL